MWVTFSFCDRDFDYQEVKSDFTHLDLTNPINNQWIIDTSIKGQEFSIVVIEGVGPEFNNFDNEEAMLRHRRELYLCASRATVFLFFVHNKNKLQAEGQKQIKNELQALRRELSRPTRTSDATQFWGVKFDANAENILDFKQYEDLVDPVEKTETEPDPKPKPETEPKKPESVSVPKSESDAELNAEESEPSSEEVTDRNLDSETDTETPQDLETVTEHKTIIGEDPELAATSERRQDSKPVNTSDMSLLKINPGSGTNESDTGVNFEEESGEILSTQDEITYDLKNLSQQELSDLRKKLEKMAEDGTISLEENENNYDLKILRPEHGPQSISSESNIVLYNRREFGELSRLVGKELKRAHNLYLEANKLSSDRGIRLKNNDFRIDMLTLVQKNLLQPKDIDFAQFIDKKSPKKNKEIGLPEFDKIRAQANKITNFLGFPKNIKPLIKDYQAMLLTACYPIESLTYRLSPICREFANYFIGYIVRLSPDNLVTCGQDLMDLRDKLSSFCYQHPHITSHLLKLKKELSQVLIINKKSNPTLTKIKEKASITTPGSEALKPLKSIVIKDKSVTFLELQPFMHNLKFVHFDDAVKELGLAWNGDGSISTSNAKKVCAKFGYEIVDKSPRRTSKIFFDLFRALVNCFVCGVSSIF